MTLPMHRLEVVEPEKPEPENPKGILAAIRPETDRETTLYMGLILVAIGFGAVWLPLAAIAPGVVLTVIAMMPSRAA